VDIPLIKSLLLPEAEERIRLSFVMILRQRLFAVPLVLLLTSSQLHSFHLRPTSLAVLVQALFAPIQH